MIRQLQVHADGMGWDIMAVNLSQLDGTNGFRLDGVDASGTSVAGGADFNGDGLDDLIIGAPGAFASSSGASFVVFGSVAGFGARLDLLALDGTDGFRLDGIDAFDHSGFSVADAGDVNGDGIDDLIIGAYGAEPGGASYASFGASYVVFGSAAGFGASLDLAGLDGATGFRLDGIDASDQSGFSVAGAGDINGDGISDLIIGAPGAERRSYNYEGYTAGSTYVVFGSAAGFAASLDLASLDGTNGFRLERAAGDDDLGGSVASAGDVNGDGVDDLIVTASHKIYVVFGASTGLPATLDLAALDGANGFRLDGTVAAAGPKVPVAGAGDINGDGIDDLIVGGPAAGLDYTGATYIVFGAAGGFASTIDLTALDGGDGFRLDGAVAFGNLGGSVAAAGDINGDGIGDLIVGAAYADRDDQSAVGESYVVFGSEAGFAARLDLAALDGAAGFRLNGIEANDRTGNSVSAAGDINGDGIDDLVLGAPGANPLGRYGGGASYVLFGTAELGGINDAPSAAADRLVVGSFDVVDLITNHGAGIDRDPDLDDLTITAIDGRPVGRGESVTLASGLRVTVFGASEVRFDAPGIPLGTSISDAFVYEISDGRGGSDTATVSVSYQQNTVGLAELDGATGFRLDGVDASDQSGYSVAGAGDVNGDGIDDVIIGAPRADPDGRSQAGESYVVFGSAAGFGANLDLSALDGATGFRLDGIDARDYSGTSVAGAGDVNGDGVDDLIIGAPFASPGGESYVVFGSAAGFGPSLDLSALDGESGFRLAGMGFDAFDSSGFSVGGAGDVNGDGIDDLIIGAIFGGPGDVDDAGASYVVFGNAAGFGANFELAALDGTNGFRFEGNGNDKTGWSVAGAGDVNADGVDDVIIGAPETAPAGTSYVVFGSTGSFDAVIDPTALDGSNGFRLDVGSTDNLSGASVAGAGDVNGDGIDDLIIGAPELRYDAGASYVVFGTSAGFGSRLDLTALDGANGFRLQQIAAGDGIRLSVDGAGDFNGDGIDDLVIGASGADTADVYDAGGETYIVFGSAAGFGANFELAALDGANGFRLDGIDARDRSGYSVAGAGDVNGDGLDDLVIGATGADPGGRRIAGESYVVFGFRSGESGTTSASVTVKSDDAEQRSACARVQLCSSELEIGETAKKLVGLRFSGLEVPDGATVTDAYIEFEAASSDAGASRIAIALEDTTSAATFGRCADRISGRPYLEETTSWSPEAWVKGETYRTADLAGTISALIGTEGLDADDALAFRFKGEGEREAAAFESAGAAPKLVISYETGPPATPVVSVDDLAVADGFPEAPPDRSSAGSWDNFLLA